MDIDIIAGKICLNGRAAPGSEGFEVRTKGIRKSESGLWVCTKCGAAGAKKIFHKASKDGGWVYRFKCKCGNAIEIEKRRKKMERYYISHPFTGNEEENKADADRIRELLKEAHPEICFMNPLGMFGNKDTDYCTALADAMELLSICDGVIFCPGWEESTGCRAEKAFAMQQGIKIMYLEDFDAAKKYRQREARKCVISE